jgi:hypothetical protein
MLALAATFGVFFAAIIAAQSVEEVLAKLFYLLQRKRRAGDDDLILPNGEIELKSVNPKADQVFREHAQRWHFFTVTKRYRGHLWLLVSLPLSVIFMILFAWLAGTLVTFFGLEKAFLWPAK